MGYREEQEIMNQEVKVDCPGNQFFVGNFI
jgi:hypothetical protein